MQRRDVVDHRGVGIIVLRIPREPGADIGTVAHHRIAGPVDRQLRNRAAIVRMHQPQGMADLVQHGLEPVGPLRHVVVIRRIADPDIAGLGAARRQIGPGGRRRIAVRETQIAGHAGAVGHFGEGDVGDAGPEIERRACRRFLVIGELGKSVGGFAIAVEIDRGRGAEAVGQVCAGAESAAPFVGIEKAVDGVRTVPGVGRHGFPRCRRRLHGRFVAAGGERRFAGSPGV